MYSSPAKLHSASVPRPAGEQYGFGLLEVLVSIVLISIVAIAVLYSLSTAMTVAKLTEVHYAASSIASSRIEELSAIDIKDLDSSFNEVNTPITWGGLNITFLRSVTVMVNADDSRTIRVTVVSDNKALPADINFTTRFARWE